MFRLVSKLEKVKTKLKELSKIEFWCISKRIKYARRPFNNVLSQFAKNTHEEMLTKEEKEKADNYMRLSWIEESLIKQKSRVQQLREGDQNTSYFFKCVKGKKNRNVISSIYRENGTLEMEKDKVEKELVQVFY